MKFIYFSLLLTLSSACYAQALLPVDDETRKITFEEIVKLDSVPADKLYQYADVWMSQNFKNKDMVTQFDLASGYLQSQGRFKVYTKGGISKTIHGTIRYDVSIDIKSGKYKYKFTNFVFEYYKQDKQYKYVPTGKEKPLEDPKFPGWERPWARYKRETAVNINNYILSLKAAMAYKEAPPKPKIKKEDW